MADSQLFVAVAQFCAELGAALGVAPIVASVIDTELVVAAPFGVALGKLFAVVSRVSYRTDSSVLRVARSTDRVFIYFRPDLDSPLT